MIKNRYAKEWGFYLVLMYMYLFLWCFFYGKKLLKMRFLFNVNLCVFIPMVPFYG